MDFNTSVAPPSPAALDLKPPQVQNPLDTLAQMQEMRARQQQMQTGQLQQQELQMNLAQRKAINQAYQGAFTPQADGSVQLDKDKLTSALATAGHGEAIPGIMENWTKYQQSLAGLQETNQKVAAAEADAAGNLAATVKAANNDPTLFHTLLTDAINRKIIQPGHYAPLDQQLGQAMQQDPTGDTARALVGKFTDQMIAGSPKQQELANAKTTADARQLASQNSQDKEKREAVQQQFQNAISDLGANPPRSADEYRQRVGQMAPAIATRILAAVPVSQYDPTTSAKTIRSLGMTGEQQTQAGQAAANAAQTAAHNKVEESQGAQRIAIERDNAQRMQKQFDATYGALLGPNGEQLTPEAQKAMAEQDPMARAIANYQLAPPAAGRSGPGAATLRKVMAINPDYDAKNWQAQGGILKDFTSGKSSQEMVAIGTALGHVGVLNQAIDALNNGDIRMLNSIANKFGVETGTSAPAVFKTIVHRVGPELVKAYAGTGGGVGERETAGQDFDPSLTPNILKDNVATTARLLQSKIDQKQAQWQGTMGTRPLPFNLTPEAKETMQKLTGTGGTAAVPPLPTSLTTADKGKVYTNKAGQKIKITDVNPANPKQFKFEVEK